MTSSLSSCTISKRCIAYVRYMLSNILKCCDAKFVLHSKTIPQCNITIFVFEIQEFENCEIGQSREADDMAVWAKRWMKMRGAWGVMIYSERDAYICGAMPKAGDR